VRTRRLSFVLLPVLMDFAATNPRCIKQRMSRFDSLGIADLPTFCEKDMRTKETVEINLLVERAGLGAVLEDAASCHCGLAKELPKNALWLAL
jgi:hypothetical protein